MYSRRAAHRGDDRRVALDVARARRGRRPAACPRRAAGAGSRPGTPPRSCRSACRGRAAALPVRGMRLAGAHRLAEMREHLRQADLRLVEDRADAVALAAVDAVERAVARAALRAARRRRRRRSRRRRSPVAEACAPTLRPARRGRAPARGRPRSSPRDAAREPRREPSAACVDRARASRPPGANVARDAARRARRGARSPSSTPRFTSSPGSSAALDARAAAPRRAGRSLRSSHARLPAAEHVGPARVARHRQVEQRGRDHEVDRERAAAMVGEVGADHERLAVGEVVDLGVELVAGVARERLGARQEARHLGAPASGSRRRAARARGASSAAA